MTATGGAAATSTLTYPEVGATRLGPLPDGYHHLHHRTRIGRGRAVFEAAGTALTTFRMHRATGVRVHADSAWARTGATVELALGVRPVRLSAPCEVVWTVYERDRTGFGYGTLPGHPERGEESFVVDLRDDGSVWFTVMAFSRPGRWYTRAAGPVVTLLPRAYARRLGRALGRLAAA